MRLRPGLSFMGLKSNTVLSFVMQYPVTSDQHANRNQINLNGNWIPHFFRNATSNSIAVTLLWTQTLLYNVAEKFCNNFFFFLIKVRMKLKIRQIPEFAISDIIWKLFETCHMSTHISSSPPGQNGCHFTDDIFRCIFMNEKFCILIEISLKFVAKNPALV